MISQNNINNLKDLEKQFSYGGNLEKLISNLARGSDIESSDKILINELDNFLKTNKNKLYTMRKKWEEKLRKHNEITFTRK